MFNLLVTSDSTAWETDQRMYIDATRLGEYSGVQCEGISVKSADSLRKLEGLSTFLMYEQSQKGTGRDIVRFGKVNDIQVESRKISFLFEESGRLSVDEFQSFQTRLNVDDFEFHRTHWAIKDGDVPQALLDTVEPMLPSYDVVLSFAGEHREYVQKVADYLKAQEVKCFYDHHEKAELWGKDLPEYFAEIYGNQGRFCVIFISKEYRDKVWTIHERKSALDRALKERREYILPARFDDTEIPGIRSSMGHIDLSTHSSEELANLIIDKLKLP